MRALFIKILIALAVVLIILIISTPVIVQRVIRRQLTAFVKESCGSCTLSLDRVHLSVMPFSVILEGVRLAGGDPKTTRVDAEAERIVALSTLRSLVSGKLRFEGIQIHAPYVVVTEGDLPLPPPGPEEGTRTIYVINGMQVVNGRFTYIRVFGVGKEARKAILHVKDIQGNVGKHGNTPQLRGQTVRGHAKGRLENSGEFLLTVETVLFSKVLQVDVDLRMAEQNLADMSFFQISDGISLAGKLNKGQSSTKIRGEKLTGWVQAQYRGLDVQFEKTKSRGEISTFVDNLVRSIKLHSSTVGKKPADRIRSVQLNKKSIGVRFTLFTGGIHKEVGRVLIKQINPGGEHGRDCSHVANQNRKGERSDQKSHDRGISLQQTYYPTRSASSRPVCSANFLSVLFISQNPKKKGVYYNRK